MLVQVCPRGAGGVRDYADCLAHAWTLRGVPSHLIEGVEAAEGGLALGAQLDGLLQAKVEGAARMCVVLHFSGYGYARRGLCQWLVDELTRFTSCRRDQVRLVVMFHELFAGSAPWRSAFWLAPAQARIARRLATLADELRTNTDHHARWLRAAAGSGKPVVVRPVFSNVGEPVDLPPWAQRRPQAVVFGSASTRRRALARLHGQHESLRRLGIAEIVEVGDGVSQANASSAIAMKHLGRQSVEALGALLLSSQFGLLDYPAAYLGKSGVFAAYAAHGCLAIDTSKPLAAQADGLREGVHYVSLNQSARHRAVTCPEMPRRLYRWYGDHALALQAGELLRSAGFA